MFFQIYQWVNHRLCTCGGGRTNYGNEFRKPRNYGNEQICLKSRSDWAQWVSMPGNLPPTKQCTPFEYQICTLAISLNLRWTGRGDANQKKNHSRKSNHSEQCQTYHPALTSSLNPRKPGEKRNDFRKPSLYIWVIHEKWEVGISTTTLPVIIVGHHWLHISKAPNDWMGMSLVRGHKSVPRTK